MLKRVGLAMASLVLLLVSFSAAFGESADEQYKIGKWFDDEFVKKEKIIDDPALNEKLTRVGTKLAQCSEKPDIRYTFRIYENSEVNAFALPGGYVYVTSATMDTCTTDSELAAILAHEVAHVTYSHGVKFRSQATKTADWINAIDELDSSSWVTRRAVTKLMKLSREIEQEADGTILQLMAKAGFDQIGAVGIFGLIAETERDYGYGESLESHPDIVSRYLRLHKEVIPERVKSVRQELGLPSSAIRVYLEIKGATADTVEKSFQGILRESHQALFGKDIGLEVIAGSPPTAQPCSGAVAGKMLFICGEQPKGVFNLTLISERCRRVASDAVAKDCEVMQIGFDEPDFDAKLTKALKEMAAGFLKSAKVAQDMRNALVIRVGKAVTKPGSDLPHVECQVLWSTPYVAGYDTTWVIYRPKVGLVGKCYWRGPVVVIAEGNIAAGDLLFAR